MNFRDINKELYKNTVVFPKIGSRCRHTKDTNKGHGTIIDIFIDQEKTYYAIAWDNWTDGHDGGSYPFSCELAREYWVRYSKSHNIWNCSLNEIAALEE